MRDSTITRRQFLTVAGAGVAAIALPARELLADDRRRPNIIVILSDDHGYADIGCQGCKDVATPNIDSIAANGIRFTDGYVSCPVCSPTRAGLMTGRYQQRFGHYHNPGPALDMKEWGLPLDQKTFAQYMKEQGYATGCVGKWHLGDLPKYHPYNRGFDEYFGFIGGAHGYLIPGKGFNVIQRNGKPVQEKAYLTDAFGREAVSFIDRHKDKPFFLYLAFNAVHQPLEIPPRDKDAFPQIQDEKRRKFVSMLKCLDDNVGKVLAKVREAGLENDTLIFFLGDNGGPTPGNTSRNDPFKGYKAQVHEGGIRVPFLAQWKGRIPAGKVENRPVISLDILPTAVAAAGGKAASNVDGVDLLPYLTGKDAGTPHESLCWCYDTESAIRMGDWKYAKREGVGSRLFNLASDPGEKEDLSAKHPDKVKELSAAWDKWNAGNVAALWPSKRDAPWGGMFW